MASVLLSYEFKNKTISVMLVVEGGGEAEVAGRVVAGGCNTKQAAALF